MLFGVELKLQSNIMQGLARNWQRGYLTAGLAIKRMQVQVLKSKIHRARVTGCNVNYEGSLSIDQELMDQVGLLPYERILCGNLANGERFETYAIPAPRGSRAVVLNGAAALLGKVGDQLIIMSFGSVDLSEAKDWKPRCIALDASNRVIKPAGLKPAKGKRPKGTRRVAKNK